MRGCANVCGMVYCACTKFQEVCLMKTRTKREKRHVVKRAARREQQEFDRLRAVFHSRCRDGEVVQVGMINGSKTLVTKVSIGGVRTTAPTQPQPGQMFWLHRVSGKLTKQSRVHLGSGQATFSRGKFVFQNGVELGVRELPLHLRMSVVANFNPEHSPAPPVTPRSKSRQRASARRGNQPTRHSFGSTERYRREDYRF